MKFSMKNLSAVILSSILLFNSIIKPDIIFPDRSKIEGEYKREIENEIFKAKLKYYGIVTTGVIGLVAWRMNKKNEPAIKVDAKDLEKLTEINNIFKTLLDKGTIVIIDNQQLKGWDYIKGKFVQLGNGITSTIGSIVTAAPLILSQIYVSPAVEWLFQKYDINWVKSLDGCNYTNVFKSLKFNAVYLDPKSPILNLNNKIIFESNQDKDYRAGASVQFSGQYFDEIIKLETTAMAIANDPMDQMALEQQITRVENLSNKLVACVSRIIAYLKCQEDLLIGPDWERSKEFNKYANILFKMTEKYCTVLKDVLGKCSSNNNDNKNILTTIYEFNNLLDQMILSISEI